MNYENVVQVIALGIMHEVAEIESSVSNTKDHYGEYLVILSKFTDRSGFYLVAGALIQAGANPDGVNSAVKILTNEKQSSNTD